MSYETVKALHIIFMVCWFAGLFYLPRLFVYHAMIDDDEPKANERYKTQERKLYRFVTPFMIGTVGFGVWLVVLLGGEHLGAFFKTSGWLHAKLAAVLLLVAYHFYLGHVVKVFARDENRRGHKFYRFVNEVPTLLFFAVVFLVVLKPF